jgi:hypothetical protein
MAKREAHAAAGCAWKEVIAEALRITQTAVRDEEGRALAKACLDDGTARQHEETDGTGPSAAGRA